MKMKSLIGILLFAPLMAVAHVGLDHGYGFGSGLTHPLTGWDHLLAMLAVGLWAAQMGGRSIWVVPLAFVGMMLLGGLFGIAGEVTAFIELGILLSVLILGLLLALAAKLPMVISIVLVGLFALFHGYAHGGEMPAGSAGGLYLSGFALSTLAVHALGMGAGVWLMRRDGILVTRLAGVTVLLGGVFLAVI